MADNERTALLNVDADDAKRFPLSEMLRKEGFEVVEAANEAEALRLVKRNPDLVLLGVTLPNEEATRLCRRIKAAPATMSIPVLHLSAASVDDAARADRADLGADGYLTYPVSPPVLIAYIKALLRRAHKAKTATGTRLA